MTLRTFLSASITPVLAGVLLSISMQSPAHAEGYVSVDDCNSIRAAVINDAETNFLMQKAYSDITLAALNAAMDAAVDGRSIDEGMSAAMDKMSEATKHADVRKTLALVDVLNRVCPM